ncbi:MAG TPA: hypothetical protein VHJ77_14380 [Vicinamibacterales bacterium]|nr:hypothetical protein [Vicinamibacterales bacterium]
MEKSAWFASLAALLTVVVGLLVLSVALPKQSPPLPSVAMEEEGEMPPALERKLAARQAFSASIDAALEGEGRGAAVQDWIEHATPGNDIPIAALLGSRNGWKLIKARPAVGGGAWTPLGPDNAVSLFNPFRDRSVYNAGTPNFAGRTIAAEIDPACAAGDCRLWIGNANGGVWMTDDALAVAPAWRFISHTFEHQNVAALALDPNDPQSNTLWAGTGEPNACGSGCTAGVGLYRTTNGGKSWNGPIAAGQFGGRAVGSIAVQPGNSNVIFAASGRGVLGVSNTCCGGVDALIPGAPHFGLYRSMNGGSSWQLVSQGAPALCTASTPDQVSLNQTACSPRGARRVMFDPVDPNTVYVSFFARGIWRSKNLGNTWEQILPRIGPATGTAERSEFDVVQLGGETRMYAGIGGGGIVAHFRRNDAVRNASAAAVLASWQLLTDTRENTPGYSSFGYCDGQCSYDNYVFVPPGAGPDVVYLLGDNEYNENNYVTGRSNGRAVLLSTNAGVHFTDMTEDASHDVFPVQLHPDHHALVTNPTNWRQFFDFGDGGVARSNGVFVDESADCAAVKLISNPQRRAFCELVLSRVPERIDAINEGLRTLHFYEIEYSRHDPDVVTGGTQDNGSWETRGGTTWSNVNIADGGHNAFDAPGGNPNFRMTAWQAGSLLASFTPQDQVDITWIADTINFLPPYVNEAVPFIGNAITDPVRPGWMWHGREHLFRSRNYGLNPTFPREDVIEHCNVWNGDFDIDENGRYEPLVDICDDWQPLGDPGPNGRLTNTGFGGDRVGGHVAVVERGRNDTSTLWAATSLGRVFVSKNADVSDPAAVQFVRVDSLAANDPPRYPTSIFVDPADANHAWITYSGFNAKTPATPGHIFELRYVPASGGSPASIVFVNLDGNPADGYPDIPAQAVIVSGNGTIYVANDFGVVSSKIGSGTWSNTAAGLPNVTVADLVLVRERGVLYAGTHGQGVWRLKVQ